jgi:hypothetical protein
MITAEDRASIVELIQRYGAAFDGRDADGVLACFTDGVFLEYFDGAVVCHGIEQARAFFRFEGPSMLPGLDSVLSSTHLWNVGDIDLHPDGQGATVSTSCIAYVLGVVNGEGVLLTRGLRYVDDVQRAAPGWAIAHRRHIPDWETRAPATISSPTGSP